MPIVAFYWSIGHNQTIISVHLAHMKEEFTLQIVPKFKSDYNFLPRLLCTLEFTNKWADWDYIPGAGHPVFVTTKVRDYLVDVWRGTSTIGMHNPHQLCKLLAQTYNSISRYWATTLLKPIYHKLTNGIRYMALAGMSKGCSSITFDERKNTNSVFKVSLQKIY